MRISPWLLTALTVALCGCESDELRVALVPKRSAVPAAEHDHSGHAHGDAQRTLHWTLPQGWTQSPPKAGGMRFATLHAPELDVAVFRFPGEAGGLLANVNRWRTELGLEEVEQVAGVVSEVPGKAGTLAIDWVSPDQTRGLLAAIVSLPSETWFFKAGGPVASISARRLEFTKLIQSLHLAGPGHSHAPHAAPDAAPPHAGQAPAPQPALPSWTVPARWSADPPKPPRVASYRAGKEATVAVTRFPGKVGGALANLNRWRQQVGLPALDAEPAPVPRDVDGAEGRWIDLRGEKERMLICSAPNAGQTWFFKLRGPVGEVDDAEPEFAEFLDSVRWPPAVVLGPRQPAPTTPQQPPPAQPKPPTPPPSPGLSWTLPEGWTQAAEAGRMRIATIRAGTTDLAVTRFPGDVGGLLQNVNRWRLQIGLEPVLRVEDQPMSDVQVDGLAGTRVDLDGPERSLRVVLIPRAGQTWFVKLIGDPASVAAEEARFVEFVGTLRFEGAK